MEGPVLVLDGDNRSALAVTRSLGSRGVSVTVASHRQSCLAGRSRFCADRLFLPSPSNYPHGFLEHLRQALQERAYSLVLPLTDISMVLVSHARADLPEPARLALPDGESLELVLDKGNLLGMAAEAGIPAPAVWDPQQDTLEGRLPAWEYPVVVKSRRSFQLLEGKWIAGEVRLAHNESDLRNVYASVHARIPHPLIQEYIPGRGHGLFVLYNRGKLRAAFAHNRLRETPPSGGVSTLRESVAPDPDLLARVDALASRLGWHGAAMFEFRTDSRDRVHKLMEVNPRFWGSLHLAAVSGQDFPWLLYRMVTDGDVAPSLSYETGVRSRWFLGDLNRLVLAVLARKSGSAGRARELVDFLKIDRNTILEVEQPGDLGPAIWEYCEYARQMLGSLAGRLLPGDPADED